MGDPRPIEPWDSDQMAQDLVSLVWQLPRERLDRVDPPGMPGAYIQWFAAPSMAALFGPFVASGRYPAYHGVAYLSLRERLSRYSLAMRGTPLTSRDLWVTLIPCASTASAVFAESCLHERLPAPLNGLGWGSKVPGRRRAGQRCSPIDALIPGRAWAPPVTRADEALARLRVLLWALRVPPTGEWWPPLTTCDSGAEYTGAFRQRQLQVVPPRA